MAVQTLICAIILYALGDLSWRLSLGLAIAFSYILHLREEIDHLQSLFKISDSELVRVSSLVNEMGEKQADLEQEISQIRASID
jgi:SNF family Na+-dependent transporter